MSSNISSRLNALVDLIDSQSRDGVSLWDIGCDHGIAGKTACKRFSFIHIVHFVDPSLSVMNKLKESLDADIPAGNVKLYFHHKTGQKIKIESKNNVFFIAGMGGQNIIEILSHLSDQVDKNDQFIIGPHKNILEVRDFLSKGEWSLSQELVIEENGVFYQLLSVRPRIGRKVSLYGEDLWQTSVGKRYKELLISKLSGHRSEASTAYLRYLNTLST